MTNLLTLGFVKFTMLSEQMLAIIPQNSLTQTGFNLLGRIPLGATGFDEDVKEQLNPVILGFVYIMYALTLVFVILGIMKARSEDKQAAMWYLILAAIIGIAGIVVKNIFEKVAEETEIDF